MDKEFQEHLKFCEIRPCLQTFGASRPEDHLNGYKYSASCSKTALHWAAKHGNEDVVKLIAGTFKADVNSKTNGGYTPLHLATQFGRDNIFELLWNVYKANRDIMDWNGNKPLDYSQQRPSISASTCSKIQAMRLSGGLSGTWRQQLLFYFRTYPKICIEIKARKKHTIEKDLGFLRIGSLNVRVKKTTEAFSNFLGVGNGSGPVQLAYSTGGVDSAIGRSYQKSHRHFHQLHHAHHTGATRNRHPTQTVATNTLYGAKSNLLGSRASVPNNRHIYDFVHKSWGSADNITQRTEDLMPPPKSIDHSNKRNRSSKSSSYTSNAADSPRDSICSSTSSSNLYSGYSSMPTTPNQIRVPKDIVASFAADSDSDSAYGFDSNWSVNGQTQIKARKKHTIEKNLGFLRIGLLNVRVKQTTEALSNFLRVGSGSGQSHRHFHQLHHAHHTGATRNRHPTQTVAPNTLYGSKSSLLGSRASVPNNINIYDFVHKSWGSADNIAQRTENLLPPPKSIGHSNKRNRSSKSSSYTSNAADSPRDSICSSTSSSNLYSGYSSESCTSRKAKRFPALY
ncbi:LOW QUALITY PROTEIN: uncharacterized protein Dwil_GK10564, partial [Drosophila willistoni]